MSAFIHKLFFLVIFILFFALAERFCYWPAATTMQYTVLYDEVDAQLKTNTI